MTDAPNIVAEAAGADSVVEFIQTLLGQFAQPSAWELIQKVEGTLGVKARMSIRDALWKIGNDSKAKRSIREYALDVHNSADLTEALQGKARPGKEIESSIDALLHVSKAYRGSRPFQELVGFMANFRNYSPYNNMLVRLQYPSCSFYASRRDWVNRFNRALIEDARPMLILAPMHPVMLVYDLDQTSGPPLPVELQTFGKFEGDWNSDWLKRTVENAWERDRIRISFKHLSSTNAGFATIAAGGDGSKMRIAIHDELDEPSQYGALCHELAHIYLGHLGGDADGWWPSRGDLSRNAMEVEAEATAYITARRAGLSGSSPQYISRHLRDESVLASVSVDLIAKVAGRLGEMACRKLRARRVRGQQQEEVEE